MITSQNDVFPLLTNSGTGKTLISAFDYRRFCKGFSRTKPRLLFVVHREEILKQSRNVFRAVLKDPNFGELYVGNYKPNSLDHLFISVQTLASQRLYSFLPKDYYDFIIVDEFHHAAAPTYQGLLKHFFGVSDDVDLSNLRWTRGGYDKSELSKVYSLSRGIAERRAAHIVNSIYRYVTDINKVHMRYGITNVRGKQ